MKWPRLHLLTNPSTTHVPVGEDQVQHLEFTRDCVEHFNAIHAEVLVKPETLICKLIVGLRLYLYSNFPSTGQAYHVTI